MIEKIISLLEAGCRVRVSTKFPYIKEMILVAVCPRHEPQSFFINTSKHSVVHVGNLEKILEVIPPTLPEYKVGDKVMIWLNKTELPAWYGPYKIERHIGQWGDDYKFVLHVGLAYALKENIVCPYHEGVNYNPLPTDN